MLALIFLCPPARWAVLCSWEGSWCEPRKESCPKLAQLSLCAGRRSLLQLPSHGQRLVCHGFARFSVPSQSSRWKFGFVWQPICGKVAALRGEVGRGTCAAQTRTRGSPLNKNFSSGVFHLSVKGNGISLRSEMLRNGTQLHSGGVKQLWRGRAICGVRVYVSPLCIRRGGTRGRNRKLLRASTQRRDSCEGAELWPCGMDCVGWQQCPPWAGSTWVLVLGTGGASPPSTPDPPSMQPLSPDLPQAMHVLGSKEL